MRRHILIVDAYNVIGNWPQLAKLKAEDKFDTARDLLLQVLAEYRAHENADIIVVFDAMYDPGIGQKYDQWDMQIVWTDEEQTADSYIEALADRNNSPLVQLTVVTSDQAEQWTVFSRGALRISSHDFLGYVRRSHKEFTSSADPFITREKRRNVPWNDSQTQELDALRRKLEEGDD